MWNVYLQTYLWGWLMSRSATVCFTDVFCIVFGLQWRNKIRQNVTFDVFWDQVVDFRAVGQKSRGDAVILLQRGIKTVKENKVTVEQHWSWSLCNPLVVPSRPEWRVKLYGTFCLWGRRELCLCTVLCGKSKITLKWRETHQCDVLSDWTLSDCLDERRAYPVWTGLSDIRWRSKRSLNKDVWLQRSRWTNISHFWIIYTWEEYTLWMNTIIIM